MGRPKGDSDVPSLDIEPERRLIAAMLRQAMTDARGTNHEWKRQAQCWLLRKDIVCTWLELVMDATDTDVLYQRILRAARLTAEEDG
jgi:hypothetical protein